MDFIAWILIILGVAALVLYGISNPKQRAQLWIGLAFIVVGGVFLVL